MKKQIGNTLALYPLPLLVIGTMASGKPTWTLCAHSGIMGHDHVMISLLNTHYINGFIKQNHRFSINLVNASMLPQCDHVGSVSGSNQDKSDVFAYQLDAYGMPLINDSKLVMSCEVEDDYVIRNFENFIATVNATYTDPSILNENGKIDYEKLKPVLFEFPTYSYMESGDVIGTCLSFKKGNESK